MNRTIILEAIRKNVDLLSSTCLPDYQYIPLHQRTSPSVAELRKIMSLLQKVIFPGFFGTEEEAQNDSMAYYIGVYLEQVYDLLQEQIFHGLCFEREADCPDEPRDRASEVAVAFINQVPRIKYLLSTDVKAILDGDPAAKSPSEIIFCYPAVRAILHQRVAHELLKPASKGCARVAEAPSARDSPYHHRDGPFGNGNRHPPGRANRRIFQYRPRDGRRHRADGDCREPCPPVPRRDVGGEKLYLGRGGPAHGCASSPHH